MSTNSWLSNPVTEEDVASLYRLILKREPENTAVVSRAVENNVLIKNLISGMVDGGELMARLHRKMEEKIKCEAASQRVDLETYRVPRTLSVSDENIKNVLMIGECFIGLWAHAARAVSPEANIEVHHSAAPLDKPTFDVSSYQFQVIQLPLRSVIFDLEFSKMDRRDEKAFEMLFERCKSGIALLLDEVMLWNKQHGLLTIVCGFPQPQQNFAGRLFDRYDLRNPVYFIERLNEALAGFLKTYNNSYFFDINEVTATFGRRLSSEDYLSAFNHGAFIQNFDYSLRHNRIENIEPISSYFEVNTGQMYVALWEEVRAMYRTLRQTDSIKMVVVDLDDTMWNGTIGEVIEGDFKQRQEGWPIGFWEALLVLKSRGIILTIISKNDEQTVRERWSKFVKCKLLTLDDFSVVKINWEPKSKNMAEILAVTNLLPKNVLFIDDNPVQRAEVKEAFPDIRVMGGAPTKWRHTLLWAPELQVATITAESAARTQMMQAQVKREEARQLAGGDFIATLDVRMDLFAVDGVGSSRFPRVLELINKTNQFNTTGTRWTLEECQAAFQAGIKFYAFDVSDRFTDYGLVGVLIIEGDCVRQFVMSCRVLGMDVDVAAVLRVGMQLRGAGYTRMSGLLVHTERNMPCRNVFERSGFVQEGEVWRRDLTGRLAGPAHIAFNGQVPA
jgi:FkbH-like protein